MGNFVHLNIIFVCFFMPALLLYLIYKMPLSYCSSAIFVDISLLCARLVVFVFLQDRSVQMEEPIRKAL